ncbi:DUF4369 domain-containing protein [Flavobacterium beibuense]|uniref:Putative lipoprotein n=1 Tax=Flavobacterium beibuense TaxID=657326 RepID=A0A444WID3_9FLAO|nr:DUF4369 domain-containing protein [Flavobacterium beibuense]RYJ45621.1 putative lipoprotein [Flavobacterium beibuense]
MKKTILALFAAVTLFACNDDKKADTNLHITGNIRGFKQGTLYIKKLQDTSYVTLDSIIIKGNSSFKSDLNIDSPQMLYLILDRGQTNSMDDKLAFFAEPGNMTINSNIEGFYSRAKITGSENQKIYEEFLQHRKRYIDIDLDLTQKSIEAIQNNNLKQIDSISEKKEQLLKRRYLITANFVINHSDHEVGPYIALSEIHDINIKYLDTMQKSMTPKVAESHYGKILTELLEDRKKDEAAEVK